MKNRSEFRKIAPNPTTRTATQCELSEPVDQASKRDRFRALDHSKQVDIGPTRMKTVNCYLLDRVGSSGNRATKLCTVNPVGI